MGAAKADVPTNEEGVRETETGAANEDDPYGELSLRDELVVILKGTTLLSVSKVSVAYEGEDKLDGRELFQILGREDLAEAYTARRRYAYAGVVGGTIATLTGALIFSKGVVPYERENEGHAYLAVGGVLAAAGLVAVGIGSYYGTHPYPVSGPELQQLVERYNSGRRRERGVTQLRLAPYADDRGAGVLLGGRF